MEKLIATIQFIGLALFSAQVPNTPGLQVLLPRVEAHIHAATEEPPPVDPDIDFTRTTTEVPPHRAYIIYKEDDFLSEIGWTSLDLPEQNIRPETATPLPRYKYVALSGELVKFYTDGVNTAVSSVPRRCQSLSAAIESLWAISPHASAFPPDSSAPVQRSSLGPKTDAVSTHS